MNWRSKCSFLLKIEGHAQEYITLGKQFHFRNSVSHKKLGNPFLKYQHHFEEDPGTGNVFIQEH